MGKFLYIVKILADLEVYPQFEEWFIDHIAGNKNKGVKGMMDLKFWDKPLISSTQLYRTETPTRSNAHLYITKYDFQYKENFALYEQYFLDEMRGTLPDEMKKHLVFNRYIEEGNLPEKALGDINVHFEEVTDIYESRMILFKSFNQEES